MHETRLHLLLLERYKQFNEQFYIEPKEETVLGSFLTPAQKPETQNAKSKMSRNNAENKRKLDQQPPFSNDIRNYFGAEKRIVNNGKNRRENNKEPCIFVID